MNKDYQLRRLAGTECLAQFRAFGEYLDIWAVHNLGDTVVEVHSRVPHYCEDIWYNDKNITEKHIEHVIKVYDQWYEQWVIEGRPFCNPVNVPIRPGFTAFVAFRGYARFPVGKTYDISSVDLLECYCKSCTLSDILLIDPPRWLTEDQQQKFMILAACWLRSHTFYLDRKATEYAMLWVNSLTKGTSQSDRDRLFLAVYRYCWKCFINGSFPLLCRPGKYTEGDDLSDLLEQYHLDHIRDDLPYGLPHPIDYSDRPAIVYTPEEPACAI